MLMFDLVHVEAHCYQKVRSIQNFCKIHQKIVTMRDTNDTWENIQCETFHWLHEIIFVFNCITIFFYLSIKSKLPNTHAGIFSVWTSRNLLTMHHAIIFLTNKPIKFSQTLSFPPFNIFQINMHIKKKQ